jgi:hypothetical protein
MLGLEKASQEGLESPEAVALRTVPDVKLQEVLEVNMVALEQLSLVGGVTPVLPHLK